MAAIDRIKHLVLLMMENRSFDHMFGFLKSAEYKIDGLNGDESNPDANGKPVTVSRDAQYSGDLNPDPGHDFLDVNEQIFGNRSGAGAANMQGFVKNYQSITNNPQKARRTMKCFDPARIPVLTTLAREFAVCDRFFSSVPGPTLPNRAFVHFGTSRGRLDMAPDYGGNFLTIYELLDKDKNTPGVGSRVYVNDSSIAFTLSYLTKNQGRFFGEFNDFRKECQKGTLPSYSVVEPRFNSQMDDRFAANDQHPDHGVDRGEEFIKNVYGMIRGKQELWESTMLVIIYDEHGGLYDHVPPPTTVSPDGRVSPLQDFKFERLGVRVPAVVVSPYIKRGTIMSALFDHTSVIATARKLFTNSPATNALTERDKQANSLDVCLNLDVPRTDTVIFAKPSAAPPPVMVGAGVMSTAARRRGTAQEPEAEPEPLSDFQRSMLQVALAMESKLPLKHHSGKSVRSFKSEHEVAVFLEDVKKKTLKSAAKKKKTLEGGGKKQSKKSSASKPKSKGGKKR